MSESPHRIETDRRAIEARPNADAERRVAATALAYLDLRMRLARDLMEIDRGGTFHLSGCSTIVQYAVRLGLPAAEARLMVDLGRALDSGDAEAAARAKAAAESGNGATPDVPAAPSAPAPSLDDRVRAGQVPVENLALVGKLLAKPGHVQPGEDWLGDAATVPTPQLRRRVNERIEQMAQGEAVLTPITLHVTGTAKDAFARARVLASRAAGARLTEGQTFTLIVNRYLDANDETRRGEGTRRVGPTSERPGDRFVPSAVRRAVLERSGDRCEVAGCPHDTFLELAHREAHAQGGGREEDDLFRLCHAHHTQFDAGVLEFVEWRGPEGDRHPVFRSATGEEFAADAVAGSALMRAVIEAAAAEAAEIAARREAAEATEDRPRDDTNDPDDERRDDCGFFEGATPRRGRRARRGARDGRDAPYGPYRDGASWPEEGSGGSMQVCERPPPEWVTTPE